MIFFYVKRVNLQEITGENINLQVITGDFLKILKIQEFTGLQEVWEP